MKLPIKGALLLSVWLTGCGVAQARIGETEKQCEERYGKPIRVSKDKSSFGYAKPPMLLMLHFTDKRCDEISFVKAEEKEPKKRQEISENERDVLQRASGGGRAWRKSADSSKTAICFETSDEQLVSLYDTETHIFVIATREAYKRTRTRRTWDTEGIFGE